LGRKAPEWYWYWTDCANGDQYFPIIVSPLIEVSSIPIFLWLEWNSSTLFFICTFGVLVLSFSWCFQFQIDFFFPRGIFICIFRLPLHTSILMYTIAYDFTCHFDRQLHFGVKSREICRDHHTVIDACPEAVLARRFRRCIEKAFQRTL